MNVYRPVKTIKIIAKDLFNKLRPAENPVWFPNKDSEQPEFHRGKVQPPAGN